MNRRLFAMCVLIGLSLVVRTWADDQFDLCGPRADPFREESHETRSRERQKIDFVSKLGGINEEWLRWVLTGAESAFKSGDGAEFRRWITTASRFVVFLEENAHLMGSWPYVRHRLQLEYALARLINGNGGKGIMVMPSNVREWLPCTKNPLFKENEHVLRQEKFRCLLIVGSGLNAYRSRHRGHPRTLRDLLQDEALKLNEQDFQFANEPVKYVHEDGFWKLRLGGETEPDEPTRDFMPAIDFITGLKRTEMWFASTYSQKRRELFEKERIESDDVRCACYIKNGMIYRGHSLREEEQQSLKDKRIREQ